MSDEFPVTYADRIREETRQRWRTYVRTCPSYGTQQDRVPEYELAWDVMRRGNVTDYDLIVDIGCGDQGLDLYLRRLAGFCGQYLGIDGSIQGIDFSDYYIPDHRADWFVCLEVIEHVKHPIPMLRHMLRRADKGVIITTPNPDVVDVLAVDPTHVSPVSIDMLESQGMDCSTYTLNPGRGEGDTILAWRLK